MNIINGPSYFIQNDWEEILNKISGEVWISCKERNNIGKYGSVIRKKSSEKCNDFALSTTGNFNVKWITHNAIEVWENKALYRCIFVAPRSVITSIHKKSIYNIDISDKSDAITLCELNDNQVTVSSINGEHKLVFQEHVGRVYRCRWFPSGEVILSCGADTMIKIWSSDTGKCPVTLCGHKKAVTDIAIIERGRNIISVSRDGTCKLWDCGESRCLSNLTELQTSINCCAVTIFTQNELQLPESDVIHDDREIGTENKIVLLGSENGVVCCIAIHNRKTVFCKQFNSAVNCCTCVKDGLFAIGFENGSVTLINIFSSSKANDDEIITWSETNSPALCIRAYNNGFFVGHSDGTCAYRSVDNVFCLVRLCLTGPNNDPIYDICIHGEYLYTACRDACVRRYAPNSYITKYFESN